MTVMEIESGIERLAIRGASRRSRNLSAWLARVLESYGDRILPFDRPVAMAAGRLEAESIMRGRHPGIPDLIIAATAATHHLTILTENLRHFAPLGVDALNPFKTIPPDSVTR
jgi:toxin FitB